MADSDVDGTEFSSHKMPEFSWKAGRLLASREKFSLRNCVFLNYFRTKHIFPVRQILECRENNLLNLFLKAL